MNIVQVEMNAVEVQAETLQELHDDQFNSLAAQVDARAKEIAGAVDYTLGKFLLEGRRRHKSDESFGKWRRQWMPGVSKDQVTGLMKVVKFEGTATATLAITVQMEVAKKPEEVQRQIEQEVAEGARPTKQEVRAVSGASPAHRFEPPAVVMEKRIWNDFLREWGCLGFTKSIDDCVKSPVVDKESSYRLLGLPPGLRPEIYKFVYQGYAKKYHSDRPGGDNTVMTLLNKAKELINEFARI